MEAERGLLSAEKDAMRTRASPKKSPMLKAEPRYRSSAKFLFTPSHVSSPVSSQHQLGRSESAGRSEVLSSLTEDTEVTRAIRCDCNDALCRDCAGKRAFLTDGTQQSDLGESPAPSLGDTDDFGDEFDTDLSLAVTPDVGENGEYDHCATIREAYTSKCERLKIVPANLFLRKCGQKQISLRNFSLGPRGAQALAAPLVITTELVSLNLGGTDIREKGMHYIAQAFKENQIIQSLDLSDNCLGPKGAELVYDMTQENKSITKLNLAGNSFGNRGAIYLAKIIEDSAFLADLDISSNDIGTEGAIVLGPAIGGNGSLTNLSLSWNKFRRNGAVAIAKGVRENVRLQSLDLSFNGLGLELSEALTQVIQENYTLRELCLASTRLNDQVLSALAKGLRVNETLYCLDLSHNPFCDLAACCILEAVVDGQPCGLRRLVLMGIVVRDAFHKAVAIVKETVPDFEAIFEDTPSKRKKKNLLQIVISHLEDTGQDLEEVFSDCTLVLPRAEFIHRLTGAGVPLQSDDLGHLASMLDSRESGQVQLGYLYQLWRRDHPFLDPGDTPSDEL